MRQDALQSGAGSQIQKRLVLGAEFDPFPEYAPGTNRFLPSNIHYHFAREPLTQLWRERRIGRHFSAGLAISGTKTKRGNKSRMLSESEGAAPD